MNKKLELFSTILIVFVTIWASLYLGFLFGRDIGHEDKGEWIKVIDTSFHYEFKKEIK